MGNEQKNHGLFLQKWWWDITAPDQWKYVCSSESNSNVQWPIRERHISGFKMAVMPEMTLYSGPTSVNVVEEVELEKHLSILLDKFDSYASFKQTLYPHFPLVQSFRDRGYHVKRRRTYQIHTEQSEEELLARIKKKRRNCVRRGLRTYDIVKNEHIEEQVRIVFDTLKRKGINPNYNEKLLRDLMEMAIQRDQGQILTAVSEDRSVVASIFLVWDESVMYYLLGGYTELDTSSFATSSLIWTAILHAKQKGLVFDFEGSMIESIAAFFRSFGAMEVPYYTVEKVNSLPLRILKRIKRIYESK